ncbi:MAG: phosphotriesterase family protein [Anaerolineae bacterium]
MSPVYTVNGPVAPDTLGTTLIHEHVMVDFGGAAITGPHRWDRDEVVGVMQPYLQEIASQGVGSLVECTPAYLGRDPELLRRLSTLTGLHIITNTGLYKEPYLPDWAFALDPASLAQRWIAEFASGIGETGIKPGFIKIAVNPSELLPIQRTIVRAAAITHRSTGLSVMAHTGNAQAAHESLDLVEAEKMPPARYIIAHADQIGAGVMPGDEGWADVLASHQGLLERGAWLEYDSIGWGPSARHVALLVAMLELGYESQLLISQDAGWYHVGEPGGGKVQPLAGLIDDFVPAMRAAGVDTATMMRLVVDNPARVLAAP